MRPQGFRVLTATGTLNKRRLDVPTVQHISPKCDPAATLASRDYSHSVSRRPYKYQIALRLSVARFTTASGGSGDEGWAVGGWTIEAVAAGFEPASPQLKVRSPAKVYSWVSYH
jgi:hypothetical protein